MGRVSLMGDIVYLNTLKVHLEKDCRAELRSMAEVLQTDEDTIVQLAIKRFLKTFHVEGLELMMDQMRDAMGLRGYRRHEMDVHFVRYLVGYLLGIFDKDGAIEKAKADLTEDVKDDAWGLSTEE
jgi:hypothetical protein